jgi:hypothetical protein
MSGVLTKTGYGGGVSFVRIFHKFITVPLWSKSYRCVIGLPVSWAASFWQGCIGPFQACGKERNVTKTIKNLSNVRQREHFFAKNDCF